MYKKTSSIDKSRTMMYNNSYNNIIMCHQADDPLCVSYH